MTTAVDSLPTTIPQILTLLSSDTDALSTAQQMYLIALIRTGVVAQAARAADVDVFTVGNWRAPSHPHSQVFAPCERAIREGRRDYSLAMAKEELEHSAALTAHRMVQTATAEDDGPRSMPTRQRARETILEAVGVIQRQPGALVQVNQVSADPETLRRLVEALGAQRQAIEAERGRRALTQTVTSQLSAGDGKAQPPPFVVSSGG